MGDIKILKKEGRKTLSEVVETVIAGSLNVDSLSNAAAAIKLTMAVKDLLNVRSQRFGEGSQNHRAPG
jgi:hypothetical protein